VNWQRGDVEIYRGAFGYRTINGPYVGQPRVCVGGSTIISVAQWHPGTNIVRKK
jgi:hypothetical protein